MSKPTVSVVIVTYNRAHLVCQAIDSVLGQTYRDFELIVVDNGSTDSSSERLTRQYRGRLRLVRLSLNQGRSVPRNVGIREARGEYVALLDSDDIWYPRKLEQQVSVLERNSALGLVHSFSEVINGGGSLLPTETSKLLALYQGAVQRGYTYEHMSLRCIMFTSTILARKKVLTSIGGYDINMPILEDWDLYLRLSMMAEIRTVEETLVRYRHHGNHTTSLEHVLGRINVCHKHLDLLEIRSESAFDRIARRNFLLNLAAAHYVWGKTSECRHWMKAALRIDPRVLIWPEFFMCTMACLMPIKLVDRLREAKRAALRQVVRTS